MTLAGSQPQVRSRWTRMGQLAVCATCARSSAIEYFLSEGPATWRRRTEVLGMESPQGWGSDWPDLTPREIGSAPRQVLGFLGHTGVDQDFQRGRAKGRAPI